MPELPPVIKMVCFSVPPSAANDATDSKLNEEVVARLTMAPRIVSLRVTIALCSSGNDDAQPRSVLANDEADDAVFVRNDLARHGQ